MVRRALTVLAVALAAALSAGCASLPVIGDGSAGTAAEAQSILERANAAAAELESMSMQMRMHGSVAGEEFTMTMRGGSYLRGDRIGDGVYEAALEGAGLGAVSYRMVLLDGAIWADMGTGWTALPGPGLTDEQLQELSASPLDVVDIVRDIRVEKNTTFLGEPVTKIAATISAQDALDAVFGQLGDDLGSLGVTALPEDVLDGLGDIRVVIYVSDETGLVRAVHEELSLELEGQSMSMTLDLTVTGVDEEIAIPDPTGPSA